MGELNFSDIFKKSFLEAGATGQVSLFNIGITLLVALILGLFIFYIYKKTYKGVVYSHSFNAALVIMCLITSVIIMTIKSNIVLSLGMVGALSIVRFRAAIKDPMDIVFLFWAISIGITAGAEIYTVAVGGTLFIGLTMVMLSKLRNKTKVYLLVIKYEDTVSDKVLMITNKLKGVLKSKTVINGVTELVLELRIKDDNTAFTNHLSAIEGVKSAVLVNYNGDYAE